MLMRMMMREDRRPGAGGRYMSMFQCFEGVARALYVGLLHNDMISNCSQGE